MKPEDIVNKRLQENLERVERLHNYLNNSVSGLNLSEEFVTSTPNRCHDFRNYIPEEIRESWDLLTPRERFLCATLVESIADGEDWDRYFE